MGPNSVNPVAESVEQRSAQEDVAPEVKNPRNSTKNDHPKKRRDKGTVHTTHRGLLSRDIVRALVRSGESLRNLRRYEKKFRAVFKPRGTLGELIFDRWWSCYLLMHLLARLLRFPSFGSHTDLSALKVGRRGPRLYLCRTERSTECQLEAECKEK
jgi:hypothetical protein